MTSSTRCDDVISQNLAFPPHSTRDHLVASSVGNCDLTQSWAQFNSVAGQRLYCTQFSAVGRSALGIECLFLFRKKTLASHITRHVTRQFHSVTRFGTGIASGGLALQTLGQQKSNIGSMLIKKKIVAVNLHQRWVFFADFSINSKSISMKFCTHSFQLFRRLP